MTQRTEELAAAFARQAEICDAASAPFYGELLRRCADDVRAGGLVGELVRDFEGPPGPGALPLRLLGGVHARVLAGDAPELARHYPSIDGTPSWPAAWRDFMAALAAHRAAVESWLAHPPQTNEVSRACALIAGLAVVTTLSPGPLRLLEIGASAGLLLRCDRFGYRLGTRFFGEPRSPLQLAPAWRGAPPPAAAPHIAERAGCDLRPVDVRDAAARARLDAFVWPDHRERRANLRAALELARRDGIAVERADAVDWLLERLATPHAGPTVVFHSSVWDYLPPATKERLLATIESAGARATATAPLHWLRWENPHSRFEHSLLLQSWPRCEEQLLARGHPHGVAIEWLADDD